MNEGISPTPETDAQIIARVLRNPIEGAALLSCMRDDLAVGEATKTIAAFARALLAQKSDQVHFADNDGQAKSLQPLLDAPSLEDAYAEGRRDEQEELSSVLPGVTYMDPPDGGAPTILEQLQRQAKDAARWCMLPAFLEKYQINYVALIEDIDDALGNRTPARQEERPSEKSPASAPLPVQGQGLHPIMAEALAPFTAHLPRTTRSS